MKVKVLKEATLTVTAGQVVDIPVEQLASAVRNGFIAPDDEPASKPVKKKATKATRKG